MDPSVASPAANASPKAEESSPAPLTGRVAQAGFQPVGAGAWLDCRHALVHPAQGWMALADLHYGYDLCRRRSGALLPVWGDNELQARLYGLLADHQPRTLILVGDIMDGAASITETLGFLETLSRQVSRLVLIEGNHDRPALRRSTLLKAHHEEPGFCFHHGHLPLASLPPSEFGALISGHHHPAHLFRDGAGLKLKLPAFIQEKPASNGPEHWILPAFSPWAAGTAYSSPHARISTWVCGPNHVWRVETTEDR